MYQHARHRHYLTGALRTYFTELEPVVAARFILIVS